LMTAPLLQWIYFGSLLIQESTETKKETITTGAHDYA
jgi:hypothetical protein